MVHHGGGVVDHQLAGGVLAAHLGELELQVLELAETLAELNKGYYLFPGLEMLNSGLNAVLGGA